MNLDPAAPDLFSIPLDQDFPGFTGFIHAWLYTNGPVFLVDPGPTATIGRLAKALEALSARPDFILLTHVHLDHSGGVGNLLRLLGPIPVIAHPKAAPHLANPSRLWEGSVETLGDMARAYGPPRAVDPGLVRDAFQASVPGLAVIPTPGHAPHHVSYVVGPYLFAGEAAGVRLPLPGGGRLIRPATPPRFFFETSLASLRALMAEPRDFLCYGHASLVTQARQDLADHEAQLAQWLETVREVKASSPPDPVAACLERLLAEDPLLAGFPLLPPDVQGRERYFLGNSIRGFLGYLETA